MTCTKCGEKPKKGCGAFPKAVVEINNPETLVLLRKVVIPASMGDETAFPPAIGKYFNVLLHYEASGSNYLYSSDGIPTAIGANIPQEVFDRIEALEDGYDDLAEDYEQLQSQVGDVSEALSAETSARENADIGLQGQIDALTVSSGVIDVLGTYQDLQNYDTTHVKEDDIIKVLQDSTHSNAMSYYKWVITSNVGAWVYVGSEGPFYTKSEADTLLNAKQNTLTAGSNVQIVNDTISATDTTYTAGTGLALNGTQFSVDTTAIATQTDLTAGLATKQDTLTAGANVQINNNTISATDTTYSDFTGTDGTTAGTAGLVPAPATTDAGKFLKADGTWDTAGGGSANCKELTAADYNYDSNNDEVNDTVALWLLDPGVYWWDYNFADGGGITFTTSSSGTLTNAKLLPYSQQVIIGYYGNDNSGFYKIQAFSRSGLVQDIYFNWAPFIPYVVNTSNGTVVNFQTSAIPVGRGDGGGPTVVQTTGTSTTDVMSQNATTSMVFADPSTKQKVQIGNSAQTGSAADNTVVIGAGAFSYGSSSVALGSAAKTYSYGATALGTNAYANADHSIALGDDSTASAIGEMAIGTKFNHGYNNSNYRLLTGLYDPQSAHDAATKGYVDNSLLGKANKISVVQTSASTIEINPNTFYKFGEVASLNITLASITDNTIYNEYMFEFVSGTTATTLTLPSSIKWLETPTIDANKIYQCSIVDNIGILVGVANV